jgi:hypothetical protein
MKSNTAGGLFAKPLIQGQKTFVLQQVELDGIGRFFNKKYLTSCLGCVSFLK